LYSETEFDPLFILSDVISFEFGCCIRFEFSFGVSEQQSSAQGKVDECKDGDPLEIAVHFDQLLINHPFSFFKFYRVGRNHQVRITAFVIISVFSVNTVRDMLRSSRPTNFS